MVTVMAMGTGAVMGTVMATGTTAGTGTIMTGTGAVTARTTGVGATTVAATSRCHLPAALSDLRIRRVTGEVRNFQSVLESLIDTCSTHCHERSRNRHPRPAAVGRRAPAARIGV